jgi:hypothetical protein
MGSTTLGLTRLGLGRISYFMLDSSGLGCESNLG